MPAPPGPYSNANRATPKPAVARCHEVFFDQSKNNSRTWFDTAACANALNLRAYRERRKAARFSDLSERDPG